MAKAPKVLIAGNWKMNGKSASASEIKKLAKLKKPKAEVLICPPATLIGEFGKIAKGTAVKIGAQDCHTAVSGAHTGDISAEQLVDAGAKYIIVGHSERRADHGETDAVVRAKAEAVLATKASVIVCVGETEAQKDKGQTLRVVGAQLKGSVPDGSTAKNMVVAYEPVWAIGTGRTPTVEDIDKVHSFIRKKLVERFGEDGNGVRILYGGSMKPDNAAEILNVTDVNGGLVGGASLKAADFSKIIKAAE